MSFATSPHATRQSTRRERVRLLREANNAPAAQIHTPSERLAKVVAEEIAREKSAVADRCDTFELFLCAPISYFRHYFDHCAFSVDEYKTIREHPQFGRQYVQFIYDGREEWWTNGKCVRIIDRELALFINDPDMYFRINGVHTRDDNRVECYDKRLDRRYTVFENGNKEWRENGTLLKSYIAATGLYYTPN